MKKRNLLLMLFLAPFASMSSASASPESWYWTIGLGLGSPSYPTEVQNSVNSMKNFGASRRAGVLDLGFYWPVSSSTILGPSINGVSDNFSFQNSSVAVTQSGIFLSAMNFFGPEVGSGFYIRGDFGLASVGVNTNVGSSQLNVTESGIGAGGGGGFGIPLSDSTRLLLQGTYMLRLINGDTYGVAAFNVNVLL